MAVQKSLVIQTGRVSQIADANVLAVGAGINAQGAAAQPLSSAGTGKIYFDSTSNTFKVSENGGAYQDLGVGGGGGVVVLTGNFAGAPGTPSGYNYQSLYVYEPSGAAVNITVGFQSSAYTYTGATISSNVIVNAYNTAGARVALSVTLTRDTTNFDFAGSPSTVVTTSTSADTLVPISVFGTGLLSVLAVPT